MNHSFSSDEYKNVFASFLYQVLKNSDCQGKDLAIDWIPLLLQKEIPTDVEGYTEFLQQNVNIVEPLIKYVNNNILVELMTGVNEKAKSLIDDLKSGKAGLNEIQASIQLIIGTIKDALEKLNSSSGN